MLNKKSIIIKNNNIIKIDNNTFHNLNKLKFLDLSENKLTILNNKIFYHLYNLEELNLNNNKIRTRIIYKLNKFKNIKIRKQ